MEFVPWRARSASHSKNGGDFPWSAPKTIINQLSCTGYRPFEIIDALKRDLGKPVVTSNQATLWNVIREANVDRSDVDLGTLFSR